VVSDIEMPQMDGLHLCRLIRESPPLKPVPVILFSSLVNAGNEKKGDAVGATAQISKPDITAVNTIANSCDSVPVASALLFVRGFFRSKATSTIRLKVIAALRAPIMATTIQPSCRQEGRP